MEARGRKKQGNEKMMRVLVSLEDWRKLQEIAERDGSTVSEVVRRHIRRIVSQAA